MNNVVIICLILNININLIGHAMTCGLFAYVLKR